MDDNNQNNSVLVQEKILDPKSKKDVVKLCTCWNIPWFPVILWKVFLWNGCKVEDFVWFRIDDHSFPQQHNKRIIIRSKTRMGARMTLFFHPRSYFSIDSERISIHVSKSHSTFTIFMDYTEIITLKYHWSILYTRSRRNFISLCTFKLQIIL